MSDSEDVEDCPLCCEPMDETDRAYRPCKCGFSVCLFCWHKICNTGNGLCPACRQAYDPENYKVLAMDVPKKAVKKGSGGATGKEARKTKPIVLTTTSSASSAGANPRLLASQREHLRDVRVIQRNLVYVVGLNPSIAREEVLRRPEYFGQYGRILKIAANRNYIPAQEGRPASSSAYVTFMTNQAAADCIRACDGLPLDDRVMHCSYGTSKYCNMYLRGFNCTNSECLYLHEVGPDEDSLTKDDMQAAGRQVFHDMTHPSPWKGSPGSGPDAPPPPPAPTQPRSKGVFPSVAERYYGIGPAVGCGYAPYPYASGTSGSGSGRPGIVRVTSHPVVNTHQSHTTITQSQSQSRQHQSQHRPQQGDDGDDDGDGGEEDHDDDAVQSSDNIEDNGMTEEGGGDYGDGNGVQSSITPTEVTDDGVYQRGSDSAVDADNDDITPDDIVTPIARNDEHVDTIESSQLPPGLTGGGSIQRQISTESTMSDVTGGGDIWRSESAEQHQRQQHPQFSSITELDNSPSLKDRSIGGDVLLPGGGIGSSQLFGGSGIGAIGSTVGLGGGDLLGTGNASSNLFSGGFLGLGLTGLDFNMPSFTPTHLTDELSFVNDTHAKFDPLHSHGHGFGIGIGSGLDVGLGVLPSAQSLLQPSHHQQQQQQQQQAYPRQLGGDIGNISSFNSGRVGVGMNVSGWGNQPPQPPVMQRPGHSNSMTSVDGGPSSGYDSLFTPMQSLSLNRDNSAMSSAFSGGLSLSGTSMHGVGSDTLLSSDVHGRGSLNQQTQQQQLRMDVMRQGMSSPGRYDYSGSGSSAGGGTYMRGVAMQQQQPQPQQQSTFGVGGMDSASQSRHMSGGYDTGNSPTLSSQFGGYPTSISGMSGMSGGGSHLGTLMQSLSPQRPNTRSAGNTTVYEQYGVSDSVSGGYPQSQGLSLQQSQYDGFNTRGVGGAMLGSPIRPQYSQSHQSHPSLFGFSAADNSSDSRFSGSHFPQPQSSQQPQSQSFGFNRGPSQFDELSSGSGRYYESTGSASGGGDVGLRHGGVGGGQSDRSPSLEAFNDPAIIHAIKMPMSPYTMQVKAQHAQQQQQQYHMQQQQQQQQQQYGSTMRGLPPPTTQWTSQSLHDVLSSVIPPSATRSFNIGMGGGHAFGGDQQSQQQQQSMQFHPTAHTQQQQQQPSQYPQHGLSQSHHHQHHHHMEPSSSSGSLLFGSQLGQSSSHPYTQHSQYSDHGYDTVVVDDDHRVMGVSLSGPPPTRLESHSIAALRDGEEDDDERDERGRKDGDGTVDSHTHATSHREHSEDSGDGNSGGGSPSTSQSQQQQSSPHQTIVITLPGGDATGSSATRTTQQGPVHNPPGKGKYPTYFPPKRNQTSGATSNNNTTVSTTSSVDSGHSNVTVATVITQPSPDVMIAEAVTVEKPKIVIHANGAGGNGGSSNSNSTGTTTVTGYRVSKNVYKPAPLNAHKPVVVEFAATTSTSQSQDKQPTTSKESGSPVVILPATNTASSPGTSTNTSNGGNGVSTGTFVPASGGSNVTSGSVNTTTKPGRGRGGYYRGTFRKV